MIIPESKAADTRIYKYQQLYSQKLIHYISEQIITFTLKIIPGSKAADTCVCK